MYPAFTPDHGWEFGCDAYGRGFTRFTQLLHARLHATPPTHTRNHHDSHTQATLLPVSVTE